MRCSCQHCLADADDATLDRMERALVSLVGKASVDVADEELTLDGDDAEVFSTVFEILGNGLGDLAAHEGDGKPLSEADRASLVAAMEKQMADGLALLSKSGQTKLGPALEQINALLAEFAGKGTNAIQVGARLQELLVSIEAQGGGVSWDTTAYTPYEWSRLARTELAFAQEAAKEAYYKETYDADESALDALGHAPLHPSCQCTETTDYDSDGKFWIIIDTNPTACDECMAWADAVIAFAGV
jgi:hypothetical protein